MTTYDVTKNYKTNILNYEDFATASKALLLEGLHCTSKICCTSIQEIVRETQTNVQISSQMTTKGYSILFYCQVNAMQYYKKKRNGCMVLSEQYFATVGRKNSFMTGRDL